MHRSVFARLIFSPLNLALRVWRFRALRRRFRGYSGEPWATEGMHEPIPTDKLPAAVELELD